MTPGVVMQPRCVYCRAEHYAPAVLAISHGLAACGRCYRTPPVYHTIEEYRAALRYARART